MNGTHHLLLGTHRWHAPQGSQESAGAFFAAIGKAKTCALSKFLFIDGRVSWFSALHSLNFFRSKTQDS
jgi:hypothetical protein